MQRPTEEALQKQQKDLSIFTLANDSQFTGKKKKRLLKSGNVLDISNQFLKTFTEEEGLLVFELACYGDHPGPRLLL